MQTGLNEVEALFATADSLADLGMQGLATTFGLPAATAAALGSAVGAYAGTTLTALLTAGVETADAIAQTGAATGAYAVGALAGAGVEVNDSDHDFDGTNGRLVFQVGNNCIPRNQYVAVQSNWVNTGTAGVNSDESLIPKEFARYDNYPNPFKDDTQFTFEITENARVSVSIYTLDGTKIKVIPLEDYPGGYHHVYWDGKDAFGKKISNGVYIYRIKAKGTNETITKFNRLAIFK